MISLTNAGTVAALLVSLGTFGGVGWQGYELLQDVRANTDYRLMDTFRRLDFIRSKRPLTRSEWLQWCNAGKRLGIFKTCPSPKRNQSRSGREVWLVSTEDA